MKQIQSVEELVRQYQERVLLSHGQKAPNTETIRLMVTALLKHAQEEIEKTKEPEEREHYGPNEQQYIQYNIGSNDGKTRAIAIIQSLIDKKA